MKKTAVLLICFAVGICAVFGYLYKTDLARMANNESVLFSTWGYDYAESSDAYTEDTSAPLYMKAEEGTATSRGIVINIVNNGDKDIAFGEYYSIEKMVGGRWKRLNYISAEIPDWNDMTYIVASGETMLRTFYWVDRYGELEKGDYRLVKLYVDDSDTSQIQYLYCYFSL